MLRRLSLTNFRSYRSAQIEVGDGPVVLVGPNGAGKTNLIEAISLLAPGRGLRRATLEDIAFSEGDGSWAVSADVEGALGLATLGTGIEQPAEGATVSRRCRIDRAPVSSATAFADYLRVIWLVPALDGLFNGPASERRRFLDRLVLAVDAEHAGRVTALERALRSRNRLLEDARPDAHWLDAIEHETAELAVAVTAMRVETVARLQAALAARPKPCSSTFPAAEIALEGWMEKLVPLHPAVEIEDRYRAVLRGNRTRDAAAGRTLEGPHLTDLVVRHADKDTAAADASTGEQKALLIGLVLAHAGLLAEMTGFAPVLLLDEVVAHLDPSRRSALYTELEKLDAQTWMTGADAAVFAELAAKAEVFQVAPGEVTRRSD